MYTDYIEIKLAIVLYIYYYVIIVSWNNCIIVSYFIFDNSTDFM